MPVPFHTRRRVEFRDTDLAGMMHFSVFFTWMEASEHELLRACGSSVVAHDDGGEIGWPRVAARCEFRDAARFEDELDIEVSVKKVGHTSVTYGFEFRCGQRGVASGELTTVCCRIERPHAPRPMPIPAALREKLVQFVADVASGDDSRAGQPAVS